MSTCHEDRNDSRWMPSELGPCDGIKKASGTGVLPGLDTLTGIICAEQVTSACMIASSGATRKPSRESLDGSKPTRTTRKSARYRQLGVLSAPVVESRRVGA